LDLYPPGGGVDLSFIIINHNNLNRNGHHHHHQPGEEAKKETIQYFRSPGLKARRTMKLSHALVSIVLVVGFSSRYSAAAVLACGPAEDLVTHLPGLPSESTLTPWYSGYLHYEVAGQTLHTHYTLIGAELDPTDDKPLIYWSSTFTQICCISRHHAQHTTIVFSCSCSSDHQHSPNTHYVSTRRWWTRGQQLVWTPD